MQTISLKAIPNQSFSVILDDNNWSFILKTTNGVTSVTLSLNGVLVLTNLRAVANQKIIPFEYEESQSGNFIFLCQTYQLPYYTQFGTTQVLAYISNSELVTLRTPISSTITASDFNPIAALPLRFAPTGYTSMFDLILLEGGISSGKVLLEGSTDNILLE